MILRDQVGRQGPVIVRRGFVEKRDAVPHFLARQKYQNMLLVDRSDAKTIQLQIVGEQDFQVLERHEEAAVQLLGHERIEFLRQSILNALGSAGLRLNQTLEFIVVDPLKQIVIDVDRIAEALAGWRASFSEIDFLVTLQALASAEDDVQVPSGRHFELLPKLRVDLVAGQLHLGDSWASATMRCTASASVY